MSFTCTKCSFHYFYSSWIQGGDSLNLSEWGVVHCLKCDERYLFKSDIGFKAFDPELVK